MCYVHNQWYDISCATLQFGHFTSESYCPLGMRINRNSIQGEVKSRLSSRKCSLLLLRSEVTLSSYPPYFEHFTQCVSTPAATSLHPSQQSKVLRHCKYFFVQINTQSDNYLCLEWLMSASSQRVPLCMVLACSCIAALWTLFGSRDLSMRRHKISRITSM